MRQITLVELKELALQAKDSLWEQAGEYNRDVKLYLHWSAGHYHSLFEDYHINIDGSGNIYVSTEDLSEVLNHTYHRNTGAVSVTLDCCVGATSDDIGDEPPTKIQIETMARVIAVLTKALDMSIDLDRVMTHGEAGDNMDGLEPHEKYGMNSTCERWDLAILDNGDSWGSGGDEIRGKANWYNETYPDGVENVIFSKKG